VEAGCVIDCEVTPPQEVLLETLMLGLRLAEGVSLTTLTQKFGQQPLDVIHQCLKPHVEQGLVEISEERLRLSDPQGFLFSNVVLADLFKQLENQGVGELD
jgi:oxygen-independent coproporphyrinogen-3 oxidase